MRCTQYIGLTQAAREFVSRFTRVDDPSHYTRGMFDEKVPLSTWHGPNGMVIKEFVQVTMWSSGMMIYTALELQRPSMNVKARFKWVLDDAVREDEFDLEKGLYWV